MSTVNDAKVLNAILNPNTPFEEDILKKNESKYDETSKEMIEAKGLEVEGVKAAEANDLKLSIVCFNKAIEAAKHWASAYNNRAQALRLSGNTDGAMQDLDEAISLATEFQDTKVLSLALVQKGTILRLQERNEEALECFKQSAEYGNKFAKQQVVSLNPYAAMCNQMLTDLFDKVQRGEA